MLRTLIVVLCIAACTAETSFDYANKAAKVGEFTPPAAPAAEVKHLAHVAGNKLPAPTDEKLLAAIEVSTKTSSFIETSFQTAIQGSKLLLDAVDLILGEYEIEEKEIDSFYFSRVHYSQYNELKKNGFQKVKNPDKTKTKKKIKSILIKKTVPK